MKYYYLTFRSVTLAQHGENLVRQAGYAGSMQRTPKSLSQRGCGYSLRIKDQDALAIVSLLRKENVNFGKLYAISEDGRAEEREV